MRANPSVPRGRAPLCRGGRPPLARSTHQVVEPPLSASPPSQTPAPPSTAPRMIAVVESPSVRGSSSPLPHAHNVREVLCGSSSSHQWRNHRWDHRDCGWRNPPPAAPEQLLLQDRWREGKSLGPRASPCAGTRPPLASHRYQNHHWSYRSCYRHPPPVLSRPIRRVFRPPGATAGPLFPCQNTGLSPASHQPQPRR